METSKEDAQQIAFLDRTARATRGKRYGETINVL